MIPINNGFVLALIVSAVIPAVMGVIAFRRSQAPGSRELGWLMFSLAQWSLMMVFEWTSREIPTKLIWTVLSYFGTQSSAVLFLLFVLRYTRQDSRMSSLGKAALFIVPALSVLMAATNAWHGLLWPSVRLAQLGWIGTALILEHGPWFYVELAYAYLMIVISLVLLLRATFRFPHVFTLHSRVLALVAIVTWVFSIVYAFGGGGARQVDLTPLGFSLTGILLAWSMLRYGFLQLVPVSREQIIDSLSEGILLVDPQRRIIEANRSFRAIFQIPILVRGQKIDTYLAKWPAVLAFFRQTGGLRAELNLDAEGSDWYEFHLTQLAEENGEPLGYLLTVKDISERKGAENALRQSERRYRHLIENQGEGLGIVDHEERFTFANPAAEQIFGVEPGSLVGRKLYEFLYPEQISLVREQTIHRRSGEKSAYELEVKHPDGNRRVIEVTATPQFSPEGEYVGSFGIIRDITERKRAQESLVSRERFLATLNDITRSALKATDLPTMLQALADQMASLFQADGCFITLWNEETGETIPTAAYGQMRDIYPKVPSVPGERTMTQSVLEAGHPLVAEDVYNSPHMSPHIARGFPTRSLLALPLIAGGRKLGAALISFDQVHAFSDEEVRLGEQAAAQISLAVLKNRLLDEAQRARSQAEAAAGQLQQALLELDELATRDPLTGAYNRNKFDELIRYELSRLERYGDPLSLVMLDIDHFKTVNDTYGHAAGDAVLTEVVRTVRARLRETDSLVRWGGEEFLILSPGIHLEQAVSMAWKVQQIIESHAFYKIGTLTVSQGVTEARAGDTVDDLLARADDALYEAKRNGRNRVDIAGAS